MRPIRSALPPLLWLCVLALLGCKPAQSRTDALSTQTTAAETQELPSLSSNPEEMTLEGIAGSPSGPGVEPPSTPTPEPPTTMPGAAAMSPSGAAGTAGGFSGETAEPAPVEPMQEAPGSNDGDPDQGSPELECVVATRLDSCCLEVIAATRAEIAADDCLVEHDRSRAYPPAQVQTCQAPLGLQCALVFCAEPRPPSRVVEFDDSTGACQFTDECQDDSECIVAADHDSSCACARAWPSSLVESEACVVEPGAELPPQCRPLADGCVCGAPTAPRCAEEDGLRTCR